MKILNLYACLGGNRYKWGDNHDITAVEWDDFNLSQAKERNKDRSNVEFIKMDLYNDNWEDYLPNTTDVVFIDAGHQYHQVKSDILNSVKMWKNPIFIFDDYGLPPGEVKRAIKDKESEGKLKIDKYIGELPENLEHAGGTKFIDVEGCICNLR